MDGRLLVTAKSIEFEIKAKKKRFWPLAENDPD
jgi:hypothetical protein